MRLQSFIVSEKRIKDAWERISPGLVKMSFKKCSISNSLDGSEDNFIRYSDDDCVSSADGDESNGQ
jgi:hypothetical protein